MDNLKEQLLDRAEAAAFLRTSETHVAVMTRRGDLAVVQVGNKYRYSSFDLSDFIERSRRPARAES